MPEQEKQEIYSLGYILDYIDGTSRFTSIFEGSFAEMSRLKIEKANCQTSFHPNRPVIGARWEVRKKETQLDPVFAGIFERHFPGLKVG
jgi:hypothetical protein